MPEIRLIDIRETILIDNGHAAEDLRMQLAREKVFMMNLMASPGSGKTSLIVAMLPYLKERYRVSVVEGDIDSMVDSEKIIQAGGHAVQLRTGGDCHLEASMVQTAVDTLDLENLALILVENIGNLVCPAEFDLGESMKVMMLSVPEGDDKILKYPQMFSICDALVVSKIDTMEYFDFNLEALRSRATVLNPTMKLFPVSAKTGEGIESWCEWLMERIDSYLMSCP
ncbi:MAG TPA: hydrogenase nickel incorporation protein HypB [Clostridiaceae bacterium]|nr:hydrogenase nickel incorporation protein HypB [Clostridiaceae bacterium]